MILANIKKDSLWILRMFLGLAFLSAAVFRVFSPELASLELLSLNLPQALFWPLVLLELVAGLSLLFNYRVKLSAFVLSLFLVFALSRPLLVDKFFVWEKMRVLFTFQADMTDWFLHLVFLIILVSLFLKNKNN